LTLTIAEKTCTISGPRDACCGDACGRNACRRRIHYHGTVMPIHEKVLEKLARSDKVTIVIERQPDGKMRVTSRSYVILCDQLLEASNGDGRLLVRR
jgi:hypothetical protein